MERVARKLLAGTLAAGVALSAAAGTRRSGILWEPLFEPGCGGWITSLRVSPHDSKRLLVGGDMLGVGLSEDGGESWQSTFGFHDWNIGDSTWHPTDPKVVWVGTMTGPYVSTDGGRNWRLKRQGFPPTSDGHYSVPIEKVLFDPQDPTRLVAFAGSSRRMGSPGRPMWGSVWESRDSGENWQLLCVITANGSSPDPKAEGRNVVGATFAAGSSKRLYAAVDGSGLFASEDGGKTWQVRSQGLPGAGRSIERVVAHPREPDTLWVSLGNWRPEGERLCMPGGIFKSTDAGRTWRDISTGLLRKRHERAEFTPRYKGFDVSRSNPEIMYAVDSDWDWGVIWKTVNGGELWEPVATKMNIGHDDADPARRDVREKAFVVETAYPAGLGLTGITVDPTNPQLAYGWGSEYVVRTRDGGRTWDDATAEKLPGGAWRGRGYSGLCSVNFVFDPFRRGRSILLAMDAGKCWESLDGLRSWVFRGREPSPWFGGNDACFARSGAAYVTTGQYNSGASVLRTRDGKTWSAAHGQKHGLPSFEGGGVATGIYALPDEPAKVWAIVAGRLYHSADFGENWHAVPGAPDGLRWLAADPRSPGTMYISSPRGVLRTTDGVRLENIGGPKPADRVRVDSLGRVYATSWRERFGGLWRLEKGTWTRLHDDRFIYDVAIDPRDPGRLAAATNDHNYHDICFAKGVYVSADGGKTWSLENEGLAMLRGQAIAFDPFDGELLVFGSLGRGFFKARWPRSYRPRGEFSYTTTPEDAFHAEPPDPGGNMLANASMTKGDAVPLGWTGLWGEAKASRDTVVFKEGPASLRVDCAAGKSGQAFQAVEGGRGSRLAVSGWARSSGAARVNVAVQSFSGDWKQNRFEQVRYLEGNSDWVAFSKEIELPPWTARFHVLLLVEGEGSAWLDEVSVREAR